MKSYLVCGFLAMMLVGLLVTSYQRQAVATADFQTALLALGQSPMSSWRPIIRIPKVVSLLKEGQLAIYYQQKFVMSADLKYAQTRPVGFYIAVADPAGAEGYTMVPRDDYIVEVTANIAEVDAHIAELEAN